MLRMSRLTDYGVVLLAHLAASEPGTTHNARQLAGEARLPAPVVSKILKALTHAGLLVSYRGTKGGYGLAREPERISVAEIVAALEGPIAVTECSIGPGSCDHEVSCVVRSPWMRINQAISEVLDRVTLAELVQPHGPWIPVGEPRTFTAVRETEG